MEQKLENDNPYYTKNIYNVGNSEKNLWNNLSGHRPIKGNAIKEYLQEIDDYENYREFLKVAQQEENKYYQEALDQDSDICQLNIRVNKSLQEHPELNQGRVENVFYLGEECDNNYFYDEELDEYVEVFSHLLETIQNQYQKAISRHSDYKANLHRHIATGNGLVYSPFSDDTSVLVGQLEGDIFLVSHFSPSSIRMGYELLKQALHSDMPIIFAVPDFLSKQLERVGFKKLEYSIPQIFNGEIITKNILINNAVTDTDIQNLVERYTYEYENFSS